MPELTKETIMKQLKITQIQIDKNSPLIMEKLFCTSILSQGTDIAANIFTKYNELRHILYGDTK